MRYSHTCKNCLKSSSASYPFCTINCPADDEDPLSSFSSSGIDTDNNDDDDDDVLGCCLYTIVAPVVLAAKSNADSIAADQGKLEQKSM